jgi:hypothetical protein
LKGDSKLWEKWVFIFAKIKKLRAISGYIPIDKPQLSSTVYEMVLGNFLLDHHAGFLKTIRTWPSTLYNIQSVTNAVEDVLLKSDPNNVTLMDALAELYYFNSKTTGHRTKINLK